MSAEEARGVLFVGWVRRGGQILGAAASPMRACCGASPSGSGSPLRQSRGRGRTRSPRWLLRRMRATWWVPGWNGPPVRGERLATPSIGARRLRGRRHHGGKGFGRTPARLGQWLDGGRRVVRATAIGIGKAPAIWPKRERRSGHRGLGRLGILREVEPHVPHPITQDF